MGANSSIEWTDHTWNPWWGCMKVSEGCASCYAETLAKRYGHAVWGPAKTTARRMMSDTYWKQPIKWNKDAAAVQSRQRVFCASMADVFEDHPQVVESRLRLFNLIDMTPHLDWLLLTKRPENIMPMMADWLEGTDFPSNIWIGTSVENQEQADKRIPHLLRVPARVRFLSCEPLLSPVDLSCWIEPRTACGECGKVEPGDNDTCLSCGDDEALTLIHGEHQDDDVDRSDYGPDLHWIIVGGESGHGARPMHPDWPRSLRNQCQVAGIAYFMKQWGEYLPSGQQRAPVMTDDPIGEMMRGVSERNLHRFSDGVNGMRIGKHAAGRLLDGRTWDEVPG